MTSDPLPNSQVDRLGTGFAGAHSKADEVSFTLAPRLAKAVDNSLRLYQPGLRLLTETPP